MKPRTLDKEDETRVRKYLATHPDFFARNPELVERLIVPHACGPAESLIERQVALLRVRNRKLERQLHELIENARDNESLSRRIHGLGLRLLSCQDFESLFDMLYHALCREFRADAVSVRVGCDADTRELTLPGPVGRSAERPEFVSADGPSWASLREVVDLAGARCGTLDPTARSALFGWNEQGEGSGILIPMRIEHRPAVLGLASHDPQRFHQGMGTTILEQLGGMLALALGTLLR